MKVFRNRGCGQCILLEEKNGIFAYCVGYRHFAFACELGFDYRVGYVPCHVGARSVDLRGIFSAHCAAVNGHFGCEKGYPWENVDSATVTRLKNALNEVIESEEESR